jgi:hypothetical protein
MIINHKYRFLFVHIQKTAGTSITNALLNLKGSQHIACPHSKIEIIDNQLYNGYFVFCFVRNPYDRLVSWWNMMIHKGIHNDFSRYLLTNASNFSDFLNCTEIILENLDGNCASSYPKSIAFNQVDYLLNSDGQIVANFIGRFENLDVDFKRVSDSLGVKISLPHLNSYQRGKYRDYYNDYDIQKVRLMYHRDIDFFGYNF